jgi:hypothetical protein
MANRASAMAELRSILALRGPVYAEAAQTIDTSAIRVTEAVRMISAVVQQKEERGPRSRKTAKRERDSAKP